MNTDPLMYMHLLQVKLFKYYLKFKLYKNYSKTRNGYSTSVTSPQIPARRSYCLLLELIACPVRLHSQISIIFPRLRTGKRDINRHTSRDGEEEAKSRGRSVIILSQDFRSNRSFLKQTDCLIFYSYINTLDINSGGGQ